MHFSQLFLGLFLLNFSKLFATTPVLKTQFSWNALNYAYPDKQTWIHAINTREFIPENNLPVGIEIYKEKLFVTVPRWKTGVPSTLNYIPLNVKDPSPPLMPYPDWATNRLGDCQHGLTNVYRIKADLCDRLWVLDTGTIGIGNTTRQVCPYTLNIFDLDTNLPIRRYPLQPEDTNSKTFIANIAVEIGAQCDHAHAYLSDELGYGLIVYSYKDNTSWRFTHSYFLPDPLAGDFVIDDLSFQWDEEGIFGMALTPVQPDGYRILFFNPLASYYEFAVSTKVLQNRSASYHDFMYVGTRGDKGHVTASFMDDYGILYHSFIDRNAIGCWNAQNPYSPEYISLIETDPVDLVFPSDVKIDIDRNLWVISDRMHVFLHGHMDFEDVNFRIMKSPVDFAIAGTKCHWDGDGSKPIKEEDLWDQGGSETFPRNTYVKKEKNRTGNSLRENPKAGIPAGFPELNAGYEAMKPVWTIKSSESWPGKDGTLTGTGHKVYGAHSRKKLPWAFYTGHGDGVV